MEAMKQQLDTLTATNSILETEIKIEKNKTMDYKLIISNKNKSIGRL